MKTVWKYQLSRERDQTIELPKGAMILKAAIQPASTEDGLEETICLWVLAESHRVLRVRVIQVLMTGDEIGLADYQMEYIDTVLLNEGLECFTYLRYFLI